MLCAQCYTNVLLACITYLLRKCLFLYLICSLQGAKRTLNLQPIAGLDWVSRVTVCSTGSVKTTAASLILSRATWARASREEFQSSHVFQLESAGTSPCLVHRPVNRHLGNRYMKNKNKNWVFFFSFFNFNGGIFKQNFPWTAVSICTQIQLHGIILTWGTSHFCISTGHSTTGNRPTVRAHGYNKPLFFSRALRWAVRFFFYGSMTCVVLIKRFYPLSATDSINLSALG